jgi:hypothetical protein
MCNRQYDIRGSFSLWVVLPVSLAALVAPAAPGQLPRDLVDEALDQPVDQLVIEDAPIRDAMSRIEQETGLRFELHEDVLELMPYGERTRVSIVIRDMSVRVGLTRVLDGLGLEMFVEDDHVLIVPARVLERLGRRITVEEVNLLGLLASASWAALAGDGRQPALDFRIDPTAEPKAALERALGQADAPSALHQFAAACDTLKWVWRPEGDRIVLERSRDEIRRRLDWPLDLTYQREPLDRLLVDLGARVGVLVKFEPGALQQVAAQERPVDLIQRGVGVRQILERICGNTGLRYEIDDEGVQILAPLASPNEPTAANIQQWVRVEVEVRPGIKMDYFLRLDQLPPGFRAEAERKLEEVLHGRAP